MNDTSKVTMDYLLTHVFEKTGLEPQNMKPEKASGMFTAAALASLPQNDDEKLEKLNIRISDLIFQKCKTYKVMQQKTTIPQETLRKYISLGNQKKITRVMLAKFVVGLQLDYDEANELFALQSYPLDADSVLLDAVVAHCISEHLDIDGMSDTCNQVNLEIF